MVVAVARAMCRVYFSRLYQCKITENVRDEIQIIIRFNTSLACGISGAIVERFPGRDPRV